MGNSHGTLLRYFALVHQWDGFRDTIIPRCLPTLPTPNSEEGSYEQ